MFPVVYTIEGATRPGYDALTQAISALSLGPGGWVQQANFVIFGIAEIAAAIGWYRVLRPGPAAILYPFMRAASGIGLFMDGLFSQDPSLAYPPGAAHGPHTTHAEVHALFAYIAITAVALGAFVLAARLARTPGWRPWAAGAALAGLATIVLIAIYGSLVDRGPAGVFERLATLVPALFGALLFARLLIQARGEAPAGGRSFQPS